MSVRTILHILKHIMKRCKGNKSNVSNNSLRPYLFCASLSFPQLPSYKNFKGVIHELGQNQYLVSGEVSVLDKNTIEITELPVRTWTQVIYGDSIVRTFFTKRLLLY